jgi:nitrogen PTS system EIIA component
MIRIREILLPENILLGMTAPSEEEAIRQLSESLRSDTRISDWQGFLQDLAKRQAAGKVDLRCGLALAHIRTAAVTKMLMAFGRLTDPLPGQDGPLQFVVLIGIPRTMDAEYLRLLGTLMRVFRDAKLRQKLLLGQNPAKIIQIFERGETGRENDE